MMRLAVFLLALLPVLASANSGHRAAEYNRWERLCAMVPECAAEQAAKREEYRKRREEMARQLATPRKPKDKIKEWEVLNERLKGIKIIRGNRD